MSASLDSKWKPYLILKTSVLTANSAKDKENINIIYSIFHDVKHFVLQQLVLPNLLIYNAPTSNLFLNKNHKIKISLLKFYCQIAPLSPRS